MTIFAIHPNDGEEETAFLMLQYSDKNSVYAFSVSITWREVGVGQNGLKSGNGDYTPVIYRFPPAQAIEDWWAIVEPESVLKKIFAKTHLD